MIKLKHNRFDIIRSIVDANGYWVDYGINSVGDIISIRDSVGCDIYYSYSDNGTIESISCCVKGIIKFIVSYSHERGHWVIRVGRGKSWRCSVKFEGNDVIIMRGSFTYKIVLCDGLFSVVVIQMVDNGVMEKHISGGVLNKRVITNKGECLRDSGIVMNNIIEMPVHISDLIGGENDN